MSRLMFVLCAFWTASIPEIRRSHRVKKKWQSFRPCLPFLEWSAGLDYTEQSPCGLFVFPFPPDPHLPTWQIGSPTPLYTLLVIRAARLLPECPNSDLDTSYLIPPFRILPWLEDPTVLAFFNRKMKLIHLTKLVDEGNNMNQESIPIAWPR